MASDNLDNLDGAGPVENGFNLSGLLSKAIETAGSVLSSKNQQQVGSVYPTGQVNPATVQSQQTAEALRAQNTSTASALTSSKYLPWIIGGGVALVLVVVIVASKK